MDIGSKGLLLKSVQAPTIQYWRAEGLETLRIFV